MLTFSAATLLVFFVDQYGLKAIEYHIEGGSGTSFQLSQGDQVQAEGETTAVDVPVPGMIEDSLCTQFGDHTLRSCSNVIGMD